MASQLTLVNLVTFTDAGLHLTAHLLGNRVPTGNHLLINANNQVTLCCGELDGLMTLLLSVQTRESPAPASLLELQQKKKHNNVVFRLVHVRWILTFLTTLLMHTKPIPTQVLITVANFLL